VNELQAGQSVQVGNGAEDSAGPQIARPETVVTRGEAQYTVPRTPPENGQNGQRQKSSFAGAETIVFMLLAGVVLGLLAGYGLDRLLGTSPVLMLVGLFAGFAVGLYAVFIETK